MSKERRQRTTHQDDPFLTRTTLHLVGYGMEGRLSETRKGPSSSRFPSTGSSVSVAYTKQPAAKDVSTTGLSVQTGQVTLPHSLSLSLSTVPRVLHQVEGLSDNGGQRNSRTEHDNYLESHLVK